MGIGKLSERCWKHLKGTQTLKTQTQESSFITTFKRSSELHPQSHPYLARQTLKKVQKYEPHPTLEGNMTLLDCLEGCQSKSLIKDFEKI